MKLFEINGITFGTFLKNSELRGIWKTVLLFEEPLRHILYFDNSVEREGLHMV